MRIIALLILITTMFVSTANAKVFGVTRTYGDSPGIARAKAEVYRQRTTVSPTMQWWYQQNLERQRHERHMRYLELLHRQRMEYLRLLKE